MIGAADGDRTHEVQLGNFVINECFSLTYPHRSSTITDTIVLYDKGIIRLATVDLASIR